MKFRYLNRIQRLNFLLKNDFLTKEEYEYLLHCKRLPDNVANHLTENSIGQFSLPLGIATDFIINNNNYLVPMVTEEPSVIAAASHGAKIASYGGGFHAHVINHLITGEIVYDFLNKNPDIFYNKLIDLKNNIINEAMLAYPSIKKHGGGLRDIKFKIMDNRFVKIVLFVDAQNAMGANIINTMCEAISKYIKKNLNVCSLVSIVSNEGIYSLASVYVDIPFKYLKTQRIKGKLVAQKICAASDLADIDIQRAITNNKGIMNGVDAVLLATGNDIRATEAAAHSFASINGKYKSLSKWTISRNKLHGEMKLPLLLGVIGGVISSLPIAKINLDILNDPSSIQLMNIISCIGLAQNLAAIHALVTDGIQRGHMSLQVNSVAISAGARKNEMKLLIEMLSKQNRVSLSNAKDILNEIRKNTSKSGGKINGK